MAFVTCGAIRSIKSTATRFKGKSINAILLNRTFDANGSSFLAARAESKSAFVAIHDKPKSELPKRKKYLPLPIFNEGLPIGKRPFQEEKMPRKKALM